MMFGMAFIGYKLLVEVPLRIHNKFIRDVKVAYAKGKNSR